MFLEQRPTKGLLGLLNFYKRKDRVKKIKKQFGGGEPKPVVGDGK